MNHDRDASPDLDAIDDLLQSTAPNILQDRDDSLPHKINIVALAKQLGIEIKRGAAERNFAGVAIPYFYSDREARVAIARGVAKYAIRQVSNLCIADEIAHNCPSEDVCALVQDIRSQPAMLDHVAAAMLMPTADFTYWGEKFAWHDSPLANSYAVPLDLAQLRICAVRNASDQSS